MLDEDQDFMNSLYPESPLLEKRKINDNLKLIIFLVI